MSIERRVLCGVAGAVLLLGVVAMNYCNNIPPYERVCLSEMPTCSEPHSTIFGYLVSTAGLYLFGEGVLGDRLRSRRLVVCLIVAALAFASVLMSGLHLYWVLFPRRGDWLEG